MNQISFRKSWYSNLHYQVIIATISAFLVVFYTTKNTLLRSFMSIDHLAVFLFSFVLFLLVTYLIAYVVYRLDYVSPSFTHSLQRWLLQVGLLGVLLPIICLQTVYQLYWMVFARDLRQTEYLERDFVVVLACLLAIQVYFKLRHAKIERTALQKDRDRWKEECGKKSAHLDQVMSKKIEIKSKHNELQVFENKWWSYLNMLAQPLKANKDGVKCQIYASEIQEVYMTDMDKKLKRITVKLGDERELVLDDYQSLTAFERDFKYLTFRVERDHLICYLAIAELKSENGEYHIVLKGQKAKQIRVSEKNYHALKDKRAWYFERTNYQKAVRSDI